MFLLRNGKCCLLSLPTHALHSRERNDRSSKVYLARLWVVFSGTDSLTGRMVTVLGKRVLWPFRGLEVASKGSYHKTGMSENTRKFLNKPQHIFGMWLWASWDSMDLTVAAADVSVGQFCTRVIPVSHKHMSTELYKPLHVLRKSLAGPIKSVNCMFLS